MNNSLAQITNPSLGDQWNAILRTEGGGGFITRFVPNLIGIAAVFAAIAFFIYFVYGGIRYIIAGEDKTSVETARQHLINAVIGIVLILSLIAITRFIEEILGINILQINLAQYRLV